MLDSLERNNSNICLALQAHSKNEVVSLNTENIRKRVLTFYGLALLCLVASIPLSLLYSPIMTGSAIGIAFFIGAILSFSLASALARTIVDVYEKKPYA